MHCCVAGCLWEQVRSFPLLRHPCVASRGELQASSPFETASTTSRHNPCRQSRCHRCRDVTPGGGNARVPPRTPRFRRSEPMNESGVGLWGSRPAVVVHEVDDEVAGRVGLGWAGLLAKGSGGCWSATGGTPGSWMPPEPMGCWPRCRAVPAPPSSRDSASRWRRGGPRSPT
jgi:hypothetical protein